MTSLEKASKFQDALKVFEIGIIIQCLEGTSLEVLVKMQKNASPLWELGNYVVKHPYLKSRYDDRIAIYLQNSSLETQAFIIQSDHIFKTYVTHHPGLHFAQNVALIIDHLSLADLLEIQCPPDILNFTPTVLNSVGRYIREHPVLKKQYCQHVVSILKTLSLDEWGEIHMSSEGLSFGLQIARSHLREQYDGLIANLLQNLTLTDLLRINNKRSPLWTFGEYIREDAPNLKQEHDRRVAVVLPTLSFEDWQKILSYSKYDMYDFHRDLLTNPALKAAYKEGVRKLIPSLSFGQMKDFEGWLDRGLWRGSWDRNLEHSMSDVRKVYIQHMVTVLQSLSLEELASIEEFGTLLLYMQAEGGDRLDPPLKTAKEAFHDALIHTLNQSSYEEVKRLKDIHQGLFDSFREHITTDPVLSLIHDRLKATWLSQFLETSTEWLMLYQEILTLKERAPLLDQLQNNTIFNKY